MQHPVRLILAFLTTVLLLSVCASQPTFTRSYRKGPITLSSSSALYFSVDLSKDRIHLGVYISDPSSFSSSANNGVWAGLGIGEQTSGSMLGADIVTVEFGYDNSSSTSSACTLVDRYVPWTAYPLTTPPGPFPLPDDCPDPDWELVSCTHDAETGTVTFEVFRSLSIDSSREAQDRAIEPGTNAVLVAHGTMGESTVMYHGTSRMSTQVTFFTNDDIAFDLDPPLPDDVDGSFVIRASGFEIPTRRTTYACTTARVPLQGRWKEGRMLIAAEPVLSSETGDFVHHFIAYLCSGAKYFAETKTTKSCFGDPDTTVDTPNGNPDAQCSKLIFAYAKGTGRFVLPEGVGFWTGGQTIGKGKHYITMEIHYDNALGEPGAVDNSGMRFYYTDRIRPHAAGTLMLGDQRLSLIGRPVQSGYEYQFTCPTACTERMNQSVNVFTSLLHMHYTGRKIFSNVYDRDGNFKQEISSIKFWSNNFQMIRVHDPPIVLNPGDQISTTCIYDLSKQRGVTFGAGTNNEMCVDFALYWPVQYDNVTGHEFSMCTMMESKSPPANVSFCGETGRFHEVFDDEEKFPFALNPAFKDTVGAETVFGEAQDENECDAEDTMSTQTAKETSAAETEDEGVEQTSEPIPDDEEGENDNGTGSEDMPTATVSPQPEDSSETDAVCFPSSARVELRGHVSKRMDEVQIGDEVLVDREKNLYSPVFLFTHRDSKARYGHFVTLHTSANHSLTVTAGHYVYVRGELKKAREVAVGHRLGKSRDDCRNELVIEARHHVTAIGLFNPQTLHGDVVVNSIVTSTFTHTMYPTIAQALLTPVRSAFLVIRRTFGIEYSSD